MRYVFVEICGLYRRPQRPKGQKREINEVLEEKIATITPKYSKNLVFQF